MHPDGSRDAIAGPDAGPEPPFPIRVNGQVIKGFGRGSKELGIPTANIPVEGLTVGGHEDVDSGVYYGWAGLRMLPAGGDAASWHSKQQHKESMATKVKHAGGHVLNAAEDIIYGPGDPSGGSLHHKADVQVHPMVMSIGWNPFYKNTVRSIEVHIMHDFEGIDFYGAHMNLIILGFIRPELDYVSKEKLIEDIKTDIEVAGNSLARKAYANFKHDKYLTTFEVGEHTGEKVS
ncbi:MAG: riboflavin kinase [Bogoriella megaspora]|nr:MAG: riboflavin kinase [Bogoriella megaspora]